MLEWIKVARLWNLPARIGGATIVVAVATALQLALADFPEPFLFYFVAVAASASALGRTAGFVAVAETSIASMLYHYPVYSLKLTYTVDMLAIAIYGLLAALSVEALCRLIDTALAEKSAAISARLQCKEAEARLAEHQTQLGLTRDSEARFRATFENASVGMAHLAPDGRCLRVNEALCRIIGYPVAELITKSLQELTYPDDLSDDLAHLELMRQGKIDTYDAEGRYVRKDGELIWGMKSVGCVRNDKGSIDYLVVVIRDVSVRKQAEKQLRENMERFRSSLLHSPLPILLFDDREHILVASQSWLEQSGYLREELPRLEDWTIRACAERSDIVLEQIRQAMIVSTDPPEARSGELMIRTKDGRRRLWSFVSSALPRQFDGCRLFICVAQDVTDKKAHEEQVQLLMREIDHRARNMLSLVQVIARQTPACEHEDFVERFTGRIQALAVNQDLLALNEWQGVDADDLVRAELGHFADLVGSRITVHGSPARLNPAAAQAIGLAIHELVTNASNYGALSAYAGRVDADWRVDGDTFAMSWIERNGPLVSRPERRGFGNVVITSMVEQTVGGEVKLDYAPTGVVWTVTCPAGNVLKRNASTTT